uniref:Pectinesterase n=1 Tax=Myoviridae sp. ctn8H20 TaxID=2825169 RepID=A0A8S5QEK4_9CAUD|nr:MAG TPA: pectinesterase [Myoviridae sp. ctn8H20]
MDTSELPTPYCPISNIPVAVYQQIYQAIIDGEDPSDLNIKNLGSFTTFESAASALATSTVTADTTPLFNGTINNIGFLMVQQIGTEGSAKVVYQYMFYENGIQIRKIVDNVPGEFIPVGGSDEALAARVDSLEFGLNELSKEVEGIFTDITAVQTSVEKEIADRTAADKALSDKIDAIEIPEVPTKVSELENDAKYQSDSEVDSRIQNVIGSAPEALDTLKELADSLGNDPDFAGTVTKELAKKADKTEVELKANQSDVDVQVNIINDKFSNVDSSLGSLETLISEETEARGLADTKLQEDLMKAVEGMVKHEDYKDKKIIVLSNAEQIVGQSNPDELEGKIEVNGKIPLIKLNEWNVIDIGSPITLTNINIPDGVRPTVQEKSQSGPNAHKMAYLDDIQKLEPTIDSLVALVQILNDKVEKLSKTDIEVVDGTDASLNDTTKDYVVVGDIAQTSSITAKSVTIKNSSISDNARLSINAGDVEVKGLAISGDFPKAQGGNAVVKINESDYIVFRDMTFNSNDVYNGIEIGLNSSKLPKYVLFDNCKFEGTFTNNPIVVFGTADDAIINIQNCSFDKVSNILRLSNKANTKCVVNISNCSVNQLETNPEYTGAILCQDYTSKGEEVANNLFSPEKITINFKNFKVAGKELVMPTNVQDLFEGPDKMVYLYNNTEEVVPYEEGRFPKVNIF